MEKKDIYEIVGDAIWYRFLWSGIVLGVVFVLILLGVAGSVVIG